MAEKYKKVLSVIDFIALDEEVVDARLKSVYQKKNLTSTELENVLTLLLYKKLLYDQECGGGGDWGEHLKEPKYEIEDAGLNFLTSLLNSISADNVDVTCEILKTTFTLSSSSRFQCEHFVQQIIPSIESLLDQNDEQIDNNDAIILQLKLCESIYDVIANIPKHLTFSNNFLMNPQILFHRVCVKLFASEKYEKVRSHFLISTLKSIVKTENGYEIIDLIWNEIVKLSIDNTAAVLKAFCDMSEHLLLHERKNYMTTVLQSSLFWESIVFGLTSSDKMNYKMAIYLAIRAIDSIKQPLNVKNDNQIVVSYDNSMARKWADLFVLLESLEESQINIVLPSLQLFDSVNKMNCTVTNSAYYLGLHHENYEVRTKCIQNLINEHLYTSNDQETRNLLNKSTLKWLMEALNDVNRFEQCEDTYKLMHMMYKVFECDCELFFLFYTLIPEIDWSPIPLYHIMVIIKCQIEEDEVNHKDLPPCFESDVIFKTTCDILQMKCNDVVIRNYKCQIINEMLQNTNIHSKFTWKQKLIIFDLLQISVYSKSMIYHWIFQHNLGDDVNAIIKDIMTPKKYELFCNFIDFYRAKKDEIKITLLDESLSTAIDSLSSLCERQYAVTGESINNFIFISNFYAMYYAFEYSEKFKFKAEKGVVNIILKYLRKILVKEKLNALEMDLINNNNLLFFDKKYLCYCPFYCQSTENYIELLKNVFKIAIYFLPHEQCPEKKLLILNIIHIAFHFKSFLKNKTNYSDDMTNFLDTILDIQFDDTSNGKLRNKCFEISCEIVLILIKNDETAYDISDTMNFIEFIIAKGGYSCLQYVLRILLNILPSVINNTDYNVKDILKIIWNDIEELKQSSLFIPTINSFIDLITDTELLKTQYKDDAVKYYKEIIEFGQVSSRPLYYLALKMKKMITVANDSNDDILCSIIVDVMLFSCIPKKDQRIMRNLLNINSIKVHSDIVLRDLTLNDYVMNISKDCYDVEIQRLVRYDIEKIPGLFPNFYTSISKHIMKKVDLAISNKKRYHFNSNVHRTLVAALKSLLLVKLKCSELKNDRDVAIWCVGMLNKLPHQNSVRIALEWRISFYLKTMEINKEELGSLNFWSIPVPSQLNILFLLTRNGDNTEFVLDILLSHTMGSNFNIRLLAQYLSYKIYENSTHLKKYDQIMNIIKLTLDQSVAEKNYIKINNDFANDFHLNYPGSFFFIEYVLPRYYDGYNGEYVFDYVSIFERIIDENHFSCMKESFDEHKYLNKSTNKTEGDFELKFDDLKSSADINDIQKKYMPWNTMTGIDVIDHNIKNTKHGELILVASLIDKLPNLGGMARTSEVFGIKTYVVANKASTEDKQFRGLSVSAEQWIDIEQVAPGPELVEYLRLKKCEGYTLIAAEQTRNSVMLDVYTFPKKSLLLLGHEKTGVPYNILPLMDACVEIPQQGVVRSLNVHVTAAIFVWEYTRQHITSNK